MTGAMPQPLLGSISATLTNAIASHGVYAVFALMALDALFPAASELVMLYAGALASGAVSHTHPHLFGADLGRGPGAYVVLATAGALGYLVGAWIGWAIGRFGGRPLLETHAHRLHLDRGRLDRAEDWFARFGLATVFIGRLTPLARSFVSIPAGVCRVPIGRYSILTLLGSAIWAFAFAAAGWALGNSYQTVHHDFKWVDYLVLAAAAAAVAALTIRRLRRRFPPDNPPR